MFEQMKNKISIHCSLNKTPSNDNPEFIHRIHVIENGWNEIGYHYYINKKGDIISKNENKLMRDINLNPAAVLNHNDDMIAICLGGIDENDFTEAQFKSLKRLVLNLMWEWKINKEDVKGHNEYPGHETRGCPNFNVKEKLWKIKSFEKFEKII